MDLNVFFAERIVELLEIIERLKKRIYAEKDQERAKGMKSLLDLTNETLTLNQDLLIMVKGLN